MPKCGKFNCEEDSITLDDIDETNRCVAIEDNKCVNCSTIEKYMQDDKANFIKDPVKYSFNMDVEQQIKNNFWDMIKINCNINKPDPEPNNNNSPSIYIPEPDYKQLDDNYNIVTKRLKSFKRLLENADVFLDSIYQIGKSPDIIKFDLPKYSKTQQLAFISRHIKTILNDTKCSSRMIHSSIELPLAISVFIDKLAKSTDSKFNKVIHFLETKPQACLEAVIEKSDNILEEQNNSGGSRNKIKKLYKTKTYNKKTFTKSKKSKTLDKKKQKYKSKKH